MCRSIETIAFEEQKNEKEEKLAEPQRLVGQHWICQISIMGFPEGQDRKEEAEKNVWRNKGQNPPIFDEKTLIYKAKLLNKLQIG